MYTIKLTLLILIGQIEPLRQQNEKLVQENNELHQQMIRIKEENRRLENQYGLQMRQMQGQNQDAGFVN